MGAILDLPCLVILSFCHSVIFQMKFSSHFSQELWGLNGWILVHTWTVGRCIVYTGIRLLLLIRPFISSFFFLSNFQILTFFVTLCSGAVRPRRLKLGTHVDSGQMYRVNRIRLLLVSHHFISSFFVLSIFQTLKCFVTFFSGTVRPRMLKLGTDVNSGQMYRVYRNQVAAAYSSLYLSCVFLSSCHIFLRNFEA